MLEHVISYSITYFRKWEQKNFGVLDVNGMVRGPKESFLSTIEIFVDCIIIGYTLNIFLDMGEEEFVSNPQLHLWILFDALLMLLTLFYL